jgi:hypothetical protein
MMVLSTIGEIAQNAPAPIEAKEKNNYYKKVIKQEKHPLCRHNMLYRRKRLLRSSNLIL